MPIDTTMDHPRAKMNDFLFDASFASSAHRMIADIVHVTTGSTLQYT
jgi:hypothetical protein